MRPLSLLGQGGDEFAAEVGDHAAPDRVESRRETTGYVSDDLLGGLEGPLAFGWFGCWYGTPDGDWKWGRFYRLQVGPRKLGQRRAYPFAP